MRRPYLSEQCDICGQDVYYAFWEHVRLCAKRKQKEADHKRSVEASRKFVEELRKCTKAA